MGVETVGGVTRFRNSQNEWSTQNEIDFINGMVSGRNLQLCPSKDLRSRRAQLTQYIKSAEKRRAWGTFGAVRADRVIEHAKSLLGQEEGNE